MSGAGGLRRGERMNLSPLRRSNAKSLRLSVTHASLLRIARSAMRPQCRFEDIAGIASKQFRDNAFIPDSGDQVARLRCGHAPPAGGRFHASSVEITCAYVRSLAQLVLDAL